MKRWPYSLLALPFIGTLVPMFYNRSEPALFGMPFFYWYQLAWTIACGVLLAIFVAATRTATPSNSEKKDRDV